MRGAIIKIQYTVMSFGPCQPNVSLTVSDPTTELSPARGGYSHTLPFENNKAYEGLA